MSNIDYKKLYKKNIDIDFLLMYELPKIAEYISIPFFRNIIASYVGWKIKRKLNKYLEGKYRYEYLVKEGIIK